jgi:hypothetical protein
MSKHKKHEPDPKALGDVGTMTPPPGDDINVTAVVRFGIGVTVTLTLVSALVFVFMQALLRYEAKSDPARPPMGVPQREMGDPDTHGLKAMLPDGGVRLQRQPFQDIEEERQQEDKVLTADPSWLDQKAGTVRIPIDRAMKLIVSRGLPVRQPGERVPAVAAPLPSPTATSAPVAPPKTVAKKKTSAPSDAPAAPAATEGQQ